MMTKMTIKSSSLIVLLLCGILDRGVCGFATVDNKSGNGSTSLERHRSVLNVKKSIPARIMADYSSPDCHTSESISSRRDVLQLAYVGLVGTATSVVVGPVVSGTRNIVEPAHADVTSKVASTAALRNLQRCSKTLPKLSASVSTNDYLGVKSFMRTPPWDEVRKNGQILVRGGEDLGPKATELSNKYKSFVESVEKIDGTASLGIRGRKIDPLQLTVEYDSVQATLNDFIKVAEETVEIPIQYSDSTSRKDSSNE
jgi:hypothetical protein